MKRTVSIIVTGKVQGVFFRQSTKEKARELSVTGTVSNHEDGSVRIQATGDPEKIDELISWCHRGPDRARVEKVEVKDQLVTEFEEFRVER